MSDQIECTCHRDGNCMCAELGEMNAEGNTWCSVCETLDEHCECGCTCICENMGKEVVCPEECAVAIRKLNEDNPCC